MLPEIVEAVQGRIPMLIDSGFRRGPASTRRSLSGPRLFAWVVPCSWGLGAYGAAGVQRVLEILQAELILARPHTGRPTRASGEDGPSLSACSVWYL